MAPDHPIERRTRFAGLRAQCACGAIWSLRGSVIVNEADDGASTRATGFPLYEVRCTCGALAHGFVPRGSVTSSIRATLAALPTPAVRARSV